MTAASLNHVFRLVWSRRLGTYVAVAETSRGCGKGGRTAVAAAAALVAALGVISTASANGLPVGGQVTAGSANIVRNGASMTIHQSTQKMAADWQSFSIAPGASVRFVQPSKSSVALNRVTGGDVSSIQGSLHANGQVFLLNPNGVLFSPGAQVDVGGLVASTLALRNDDFLAGRYRLSGDSAAAVVNQGSINAPGGGVALIAAKVGNSGSIRADGGQVVLGSASDVTLDLGASVKLQIHRGALDSQIDNGGAIQADGGTVLLTARAADELTSSVINSRGTVRARTLATGEKGEILLIGDMSHGQLDVSGRLDATAPQGGDGGFIETSAAHVVHGAGLQVDAASARGAGGLWLVDPYDYTINASSAATIAGALNTGTSVTVTTQSNAPGYGSAGNPGGSGDITVASPISKTSGGNATLTLRADRNVVVNAPITSTSGALGITLSSANNLSSSAGGVSVASNLLSNGGRILVGGAGGNAISTQSYGIGYALNPTLSDPAVKIGTGVTIASAGGNITINGRTMATANSYSGSKGGIYVLSGATVDSGGGFLYMSAISAGSDKQFAFGVEANSGTVTTFRTSSTTGGIVVDALNTLDPLGSLGLVNNGGQAKVQFWAPNVAYFLFRLNGNNQAANFTQSSPCHPGYPNCGTMVIPGGNQSYTSAGYNVKQPELLPIYVFTGNGSKVYDGNTLASGVALTSLAGPGGFNVSQLGTLGFRTPSKNVGTYDILTGDTTNPSTYSTNYAVAYFTQGAYSITQRSLGTLQAATKVYDGTTAAAVSASGLVAGDNATVTATGGFASANVGTGVTVNVTSVSLTGPDAGNYSVPAFNGLSTTADITPAQLLVTANGISKTYDGQAFLGGNGVTLHGLVNGETPSVLGGSLSYAGSSQGAVNAGQYLITPQGLTAANYNLVYGAGQLTVNPATLTYVAGAASRTYGATNPTLTGAVSGFVNGETLASATTGVASFNTPATATSAVGSYPVTGAGLAANHGNYVLVQGAGNQTALTISPAALTVTANGASKVYDGLAYSGGNGVTLSGLVNGESASALAGQLSYAGSSQGAVNAGQYTLTPQGLTSSNYSITFSDAQLTVNPATLTYVANTATRLYGASAPALSGTLSGLVNGETLASATTGSATFSTAATTTSGIGTYGVIGGGLVANHGNYVMVQGAGNSAALTITPAPLTVAANSASKTFDGLAFNGGNGITLSGLVNGESAAVLGGQLSYAGTSQGAVNAGLYTITPQGLIASNYALTFTDGQLTVNPASIAITPVRTQIVGALTGTSTKVYDGSTVANLTSSNYLMSGFVGSDGAVVTQTRGQYDNANAGVGKTVTVALSDGDFAATHGTLLSNYVLPTQLSGAIGTITPAPLTVAANSSTKTYDGQAWAGGNGVAISGLVNGETAAVLSGLLSYSGNSQGAVNAGRYAITPQGLSATNYAISYLPGTLTVDPATLTYVSSSASRLYGAPNPVIAGSISGLVDADTLATATTGSLLFTTTATSASGTGAYRVDGGGLVANHGNYLFQQSPSNAGALVVTPAPLTLTAANASTTYNGQAWSGGNGVSLSGLVNGETASVLDGVLTYEGTSQGAVNAGRYAIAPRGLSSSNYDVRFVDGALDIKPATLTLTAAPAARAAGAALPVLTGTVSGFVAGETLATATSGRLTFTADALAASAEGSYAVTGGGLTANFGNYVFVQDLANAQALTVMGPRTTADAFLPRTTAVPNFPDNALPALGSTTGPQSFGNLNYVPVTNESSAAATAKAAKTGTAGIAVPSANGPLDVFVMEGGINTNVSDRRPR